MEGRRDGLGDMRERNINESFRIRNLPLTLKKKAPFELQEREGKDTNGKERKG